MDPMAVLSCCVVKHGENMDLILRVSIGLPSIFTGLDS
jgi:hypothetical protein